MTTMDSDSESQDSDDGRRFRFEATRKDAASVSHNRKRLSPHSGRSGRRSRSRGRSDRDRRDNERFSNRGRDSRAGHNSRQTSRDRDLKDRRDRHSSQNYHLKDTKDAHDSKHLKQRNGSSTQREKDDRETRDAKDTREPKDTKDTKETREPRESHSKSSRSHEKDSRNSKETRSSRDRNRKRSRDRSRSDRSSSDKHKAKVQEKLKSHSKDNQTRVKEDRVAEKVEEAKAAPLLIGQPVNESKKEVAEFNLSDFEVVSDTENSSDALGHSPSDRSKVKKLLSKQQSQRLSERDSERKSHRREDLRKVNPRNGSHSSASSNSNPSALSDFSLGSASSTTTSANKKLKGDEEEASRMEVDVENSQDSSVVSSQERTKSNESDKPFSYGPVLPPLLVRGSSPDPRPVDDQEEEEEEGEIVVKMAVVQSESVENVEREEDVEREKVIGPSLPRTSVESSDPDLENVLSPRVKEANLEREGAVVKSEAEAEEESSGVVRGVEESLKGSSQPRIIGPSLPARFLPQTEESDEDAFGPALPPHLAKKDQPERRVFGPTLPSELKSDDAESAEESDDGDIIGPLPPDHPAARSSIVQQSLEFRARRIQSEFMAQQVPKEKKREEWMTELPAVRSAALGLGPRKFKARAGPDLSDRSSWTDTPADRARKEQEKAEERLAALVTEKAMVHEISTSKEDVSEKSTKRPKSLMEMHQKKLKKKKKKEEKEAKEKGKQPTRRPFDRDVDLQANRFDEAQKKHVFMKAQLLDDRFARGSI